MKRYSTLLLLACWMIILFVLSTVSFCIDYSKDSHAQVPDDQPPGLTSIHP